MLLFVVTTVPLQDTTYYRSSGPLPLLTTVTVVNKKSNQTQSMEIVSDPSAYLETSTVIFFLKEFSFLCLVHFLAYGCQNCIGRKKKLLGYARMKNKRKVLVFLKCYHLHYSK